MNIDLNKLISKDYIEINEEVIIPDSYINDKIKGFLPFKVNGRVYLQEECYKINLNVLGSIFLIDSFSLDKVEYKMNFQIDDEIDEKLINNQNMLDLTELLWENIVLEVPISYSFKKDAIKKGDNWQFKEDEENNEIDPRLEKLLEIYNKGGE